MNRMRTSRHARVGGFVLGVALVLVASLISSATLATPGIVKTKSGAIYSGDIEERGNQITVTIRGVITRLPKSDVESIEYQQGTIDEQIESRRAKLAADDVNGRLEIARLALENHMFDKALELALEAVQIEPENNDAIAMRQTIRLQRQQYQSAQRNPGRGTTSDDQAPPVSVTTTVPTTNPANAGAAQKRFLSADDIQQIRRKELKVGDNARVQIPQDVKRNYAARMGIPFAQFNQKPPIEQALDIIENGDDEMRAHVKVMSDPESIIEYKRLQGMILTGCATSNCHGGQNNESGAGNLTLHAAENDPATYTNFYILTQYSKNVGDAGEQGIFSGTAERKLVERGRGDSSLLAQYGLAPAKATMRHPKIVKGNAFNGIFRDQEDQRYKRLVEWMNNSLKRIEPTYNIDYPVARAASLAPPTTGPTTLPSELPGASTMPGARPTRPRPAATRPATTRPAPPASPPNR
jgi:hypothetical protein